MFIQQEIKIEVALDRVDSADPVDHQNFILPVTVMVDIAERKLWQVRRLRAEGVISHELRFQSGKFPDKEIHHSMVPEDFVPVGVPWDICA